MTARHVEQARARFERIAFADHLGTKIVELAPDRAVLLLPYRLEHMNAGGVLNGGASASVVTLTGTLAAWTGIDVDAMTDLRCVDVALQYLNPAREDDILGEARVLRRGRDVVFVEVAVRARAGAPICQGLLTYQTADRGGRTPRLHAAHIPLPSPSPLITPAHHRLFQGYVTKLEIAPLHESPGRVRLRMPCTPSHVNENGHVDAGALASIVDIAGVAASWSLVGRKPGARGSTIGLQVSFPSTTSEGVVADAHVQQRSESLLFSTVHVTSASSAQLVALGQVSYRLLEPWPA